MNGQPWQWVEAGVAFAVTALALFVWLMCNRFLLRSAHSTSTDWDNIILRAVNAPITTLIILLGGEKICGLFLSQWADNNLSISNFFDTMQTLTIAIIVFWIALRLISGLERKYRNKQIALGEKSIDAGTIYLIFRMIRAIIIVIAVLTLMHSFGVSISGILAFGGLGGVLFGFAAKDTLANFFAGLMIFWERPFVVGDWIRCASADIEGVVEHIGWRMTQVRTFDQRPLYMPNALFFNSVIENPQRMTNRRIYEYFGVCYDNINALPKVLADIRAMLKSHNGIAQDKIQMVHFEKYGASSLDFFVYVMTETTDWGEFHTVKEDILFKIADIVRANGCEFAFPTRTIIHQNADAPPPVSG